MTEDAVRHFGKALHTETQSMLEVAWKGGILVASAEGMPLPGPRDPAHQVPKGVYAHYKGQRYEVVGTAVDAIEALAVYRALYESPYEFFARPAAMFLGCLPDGRRRFTLVEPR